MLFRSFYTGRHTCTCFEFFVLSISMNIKIFFVLLFSVSVVSAQVGTTGLPFLKLGIGARTSAMGEVSVGSDIAASITNPALLGENMQSMLQFTHRAWTEETTVDFFGANEAEGEGAGELRTIGRGSRRAVMTNSPPSRCIETQVFAQPAPRAAPR